MRKSFYAWLIVFMITMKLSAAQAETPNQTQDLCPIFNQLSGIVDGRTVVLTGQVHPGEVYRIDVRADQVWGTVQMVGNTSGVPVLVPSEYLDTERIVSLIYTVPDSGLPEGVGYHFGPFEGEGSITVTASCTPVGSATSSPAPGCDVMLNIPTGSVVGQFKSDAPTYWRPGNATSPLVTIPEGKTAWVLGLNSTGEYYRIIWQCTYLWVQASTLGPNPDRVWNSAPLPVRTIN